MHWPGHRYCGPGTDIAKSDLHGGPTNALDACCRKHDLELEGHSETNQEEADNNFAECAQAEGSVLGNLFSGAIHLKNQFGKYTGLERVLPGQKHPRTPGKSDWHQDFHTPNKLIRLQEEGNYEQSNFNIPAEENIMAEAGAPGDPAGPSGGSGLARSMGGTGGRGGGGGQVPPQDLRPQNEGRHTFFFSRTFRHYIPTHALTYADAFNQGWCIIPYEAPCASMMPRDFQFINVAAKRWRILNCGFKMGHIIPIKNTMTTTGGAVSPNIEFNMMPYCETYVDKGYQLPPINLAPTDYPNHYMTQNSGNQTTANLSVINLTTMKLISDKDYGNPQLNYMHSIVPWAFDLMNSTEWGTVNPGEYYSFEWTAEKYDLKWRHSYQPFNSLASTTGLGNAGYQSTAHAYGRWDGNIFQQTQINTSTQVSSSNINQIDNLKANYKKPIPTALIRPCSFHDADNTQLPVVFQCLVKYHCTIELDMNDIAFTPLLPGLFEATATTKNIYDILSHDMALTAVQRSSTQQWSGCNFIRHTTGPSDTGAVVYAEKKDYNEYDNDDISDYDV